VTDGTKKTSSVSSSSAAGADPKEDLIHAVLTAVEENWLNQAPQPTLDKSRALLAMARGASDETDVSERDVSSEAAPSSAAGKNSMPSNFLH
jgi:hypothetical protein